MIKHRTFKFTYNGIVSVRFPVDMRFDSDSRIEGEEAFHLVSEDGRLRLCVEFFTSTKSARELIEELYSLTEHDFILPPCSIKTPTGIDGYFTTYKQGDDCYEECTLDLGGDTRINYWFLYKMSNPCDQSLYKQMKAELLENIRKV